MGRTFKYNCLVAAAYPMLVYLHQHQLCIIFVQCKMCKNELSRQSMLHARCMCMYIFVFSNATAYPFIQRCNSITVCYNWFSFLVPVDRRLSWPVHRPMGNHNCGVPIPLLLLLLLPLAAALLLSLLLHAACCHCNYHYYCYHCCHCWLYTNAISCILPCSGTCSYVSFLT